MSETTERWSIARAQSWHESHGWLCGCNFLPSSAVNSTEMWQAETFDAEVIARELDLARGLGFNSARVFLQFLVWESDATKYLHRFEKLLELAHDRGILVVPVLFDDCAFSGREPYLGPQDAPVLGRHNGGWTASPGASRADDPGVWPQLRKYLQAFVGQWSQDARVAAWDLYNEPGNSNRGDGSLPLLRESFAWAREMAPTQPITSGVWTGDDSTPGCNAWMRDRSDVLSFHCYDTEPNTRAAIRKYLGQANGRPLLCTEWMARHLGSTWDILPAWKEAGIGCFSWGLVRGKTQTHLPWDFLKGGDKDAPGLWFHDVFEPDGTPYDAEEIAFIRGVTGA